MARDFARGHGHSAIVAMLDAVTTSKEERRRVWAAARPWSVATHGTFSLSVQRRAVLLHVIGRRLAAERMGGVYPDHPFITWWERVGVHYVLDPWGMEGDPWGTRRRK